MRSRTAARMMMILLPLSALSVGGCQSGGPTAWGPTRTETGWSTGVGDPMGTHLAQARPRIVAFNGATKAREEQQLANVRTEP